MIRSIRKSHEHNQKNDYKDSLADNQLADTAKTCKEILASPVNSPKPDEQHQNHEKAVAEACRAISATEQNFNDAPVREVVNPPNVAKAINDKSVQVNDFSYPPPVKKALLKKFLITPNPLSVTSPLKPIPLDVLQANQSRENDFKDSEGPINVSGSRKRKIVPPVKFSEI